jgi:hypothetical protein
MIGLDAFRAANFDWTRHLKSVWRDPTYHMPSLHRDRVDDVIDYFTRKTRDPESTDEPLGYVIVAPAGYGKTHLVGEVRRRVWDVDGWFVLLDFVGIKDFWSSAALGFVNSLQVRMPNGKTQYDQLIIRLASLLSIDQDMVNIAKRWRGRPRELVTELANLFVRSLSRVYFHETSSHRNVITALILLISEDLDCHSIAHAWLQGMDLDNEIVTPLGFLGPNDPVKVVQGLSWVMSLVGPTLIAVDQIDAIVSTSNAKAAAAAARDEELEAQSIVESLALGLMDLHERKQRAVTVISCLEATWKVLQDRATVAVTDRYNSPTNLRALPNGEFAAELVASRLAQTYLSCNFKPPYPTWPFVREAFDTAIGFSPRQLLKACEAHRQRCVAQSAVAELKTFLEGSQTPTGESPDTSVLVREYERQKAAASIGNLLDAKR